MQDRKPVVRAAERLKLAVNARCKVISGVGGDVVLIDMSTTGCRIIIRGLRFHPGNRVILTPHKFESIVGTIKWIANSFAGIEFDRPIYGPVVEHFQKTNPAGGSSFWSADKAD